jgi:hypothetical protein
MRRGPISGVSASASHPNLVASLTAVSLALFVIQRILLCVAVLLIKQFSLKLQAR